MCRVNSLAPVGSINTESLHRRVGIVSQVFYSDSSGMRAQYLRLCQLFTPRAAPSFTIHISSVFMHGSNRTGIFLRDITGTINMKSILHITCRMVLGLEQGIKVPETTLNYIAFDLCESHLQKDLAHLIDKPLVGVCLHTIYGLHRSINIICTQMLMFPGTCSDHICA